MNEWYLVIDHVKKGRWLTQKPIRYQNNPTRYSVFGPMNLAAARFNLFGRTLF